MAFPRMTTTTNTSFSCPSISPLYENEELKSSPSISSLTWEQLKDVCDQLRRPLTDRPVLIPFTTKAFWLGRLTPTTARAISSSSTTSVSVDGGSTALSTVEELVHVRRGVVVESQRSSTCSHSETMTTTQQEKDLLLQHTETMTRREAIDFLNDEMDRIRKLASTTSKCRLPPQGQQKAKTEVEEATVRVAATAPTLVQGRQQRNAESATSTIKSHRVNNTSNGIDDNDNSTLFPFCEIREELDSSGKEVRGELVPVSELISALLSGENGNNSANSSRGGNTTRSSSYPGNFNSSSSPPVVSMDNHHALSDNNSLSGGESRQLMSEQEYAALSARLDLLARLEEEEIQNQQSKTGMHTKKAGKGWSRGFLNKAKTNSENRVVADSNTGLTELTRTAQSNSVAPTVTLQPSSGMQQYQNVNNDSIDFNLMLQNTRRSTTDQPQSISPTAFSGMIQERNPINPSTHQPHRQQQAVQDADATASGRKVAFAKHDEVREIPRIGTSSVPRTRMNHKASPIQSVDNGQDTIRIPSGQATSTQVREHDHQSITSLGQKKLSRFAQERQGLR